MAFRIALSGLNAANAGLNVTANNIANVNTTGFKRSRAEFSDVITASPFGVSRNVNGNGVRVNRIAQQHEQGSVSLTGNYLDLAISGEGFFTLGDSKGFSYTRAGAFGLNRDGFITNANGQFLQGYPALVGGGFNTGALGNIQIDTSNKAPQATSNVFLNANLPATDLPPTVAVFNPATATSYNRTTSATYYDSLGAEHVASFYWVKGAAPGAWTMHSYVDGVAVGAGTPLTFSTSGTLTAPVGGTVTLPPHPTTNGSDPLAITLDLSNSTQYGGSFGVNELRQNGYTAGRIVGLEVSQEGIVQARYTNGQTTQIGQVAMANFASPQSLSQAGDTNWVESFESGAALRGVAGSASLGLIQAGALEESNVDLTQQLVSMITHQRNFQANAQMISTADQVTQTILNIR